MPRRSRADRLNDALERNEREQRIYSRMTELNELARSEQRDLTPDEQAEWAEGYAEYRRIREERGREDALAEIRSEIAPEDVMPENPTRQRQPGELTREQAEAEVGYAALELLRRKGFDQIQRRDILMDQGASGGLLVGTEMARTILSVNPEREIIRPRAMVIPAGDQPNATFEIPYFDQSSSVAGSVAFEHRKESEDMSESDADFGMLRLEPKEQSTYLQIGKKTAVNGNAVGLGAFLSQFFRREKAASEDYMFLRGTGNNQPLGMLNAPCKLNVTRNTSASIKFADLTGMVVKMLDQTGAMFAANRTALSELVSIADASGNNLIYQPGNITQGIPSTLFGIPLMFTTNLPALGTEGDLMLINPNYYVIKDGRAWELMLYDVRPEKQLLDYVGVWDVDGAPWLKSAVTMKDGNSYSPVVVLK